MKRSERLHIIEKLAQQREDQAAKALAQLRAQLENEQAQLDELDSYRTEYQSYLQRQGSEGLSIVQWRRTQGFIDQLSQVMRQQQQVISRFHEQEGQLLQHWQRLYQRRKSLGQLVERVSLDEFIAADRAEQKAIDELVSQMGNTRQLR
ncbi:MAG: flagellar export protein FliJ [Saccharospirillum sp.]|nr:flagellar export protein FliJ [Saccharospirillum sp.]